MSQSISKGYLGQIAATDTTVYTCPANTQARVIKCTATNDTTTVTTLSAHKVESGGSVGVDRLIMNSKSIGNKETYECPEVVGQVLEAGDIISMIAGVAAQITIALDVVEIV